MAIAALAIAIPIAGCGGEGSEETGATGSLSGRIKIDGSSTVFPLTQAAAEMFKAEASDVRISVGQSGTGGGFEKFCKGETDMSDASRAIEDDEVESCEKAGISYVELRVGSDGITVAANPANAEVSCLTVDQLKKVWDRGSKIDNWSQIDPELGDRELKLFGPGTDSGTFDFFTEQINGEEGRSRSDYTASEDDNVLVKGVAGDEGGLGYFGFSYYEQNQDKLKLVEIDGGKGCVAPSAETIQDGSYAPLSRPLYVYVSREALGREAVEAFADHYLENAVAAAEAAQLVPASQDVLEDSKAKLAEAR